MMLLVGSKALRAFGDKYLSPKANRSWDTDWIATYEDFEEFKELSANVLQRIVPLNRGKTIAMHCKGEKPNEFEIAWEGSTAEELLKIVLEENLAVFRIENGEGFYIAKPEVIFTLKKSHRFLRDSPHFLKTMHDYHYLRDEVKLTVPDALKDWYKKRIKETYWYKHPNLNVTKDEFFKMDEVPYEVVHDDIHISVKQFDKPAYCYYMKEGAEVQCDKQKFLNCSREIQLAGVAEEAAVLAIERSLIPFPGAWSPKYAWEFALIKVCSSITGGWFRSFAYENYFHVLKLYPKNYWKNFQKDVSNGLVRPTS